MIEYIIEDRVCYCIDKLILEIVRFNDCDLYIYLGFYIYIYIDIINVKKNKIIFSKVLLFIKLVKYLVK